jgi:hypothetical protein
VSVIGLLLAAAAGGAAGWMLARRRGTVPLAAGVGPHLLPDPALEWLRRSYGALGVWVAELDPQEKEPHAERIVDTERLSVAQIVAVDRRLERARDQEQSGAERLDSGTLVFHAAIGTAVALLLPPNFEARRLGVVEADLKRLLDGTRRRPQVVALAQAQTQEASLESPPAGVSAGAGTRCAGDRGSYRSGGRVASLRDNPGLAPAPSPGAGSRRLRPRRPAAARSGSAGDL